MTPEARKHLIGELKACEDFAESVDMLAAAQLVSHVVLALMTNREVELAMAVDRMVAPPAPRVMPLRRCPAAGPEAN